MPIILQEEIKDKFSFAVWQIDENLSFFLNSINLSEAEKIEINNFNEKRLLEWYASRYLLFKLEKKQERSFCLKDKFGKPFFKNLSQKLSISHSGEYVAAVISTYNIGIDIQKISEKVEKIKYKFLSKIELKLCGKNIKDLNRYWTAKEAMYKTYGIKGLDFIENIRVNPFVMKNEYLTSNSCIIKSNNRLNYSLYSKDIKETVLTIAIEN